LTKRFSTGGGAYRKLALEARGIVRIVGSPPLIVSPGHTFAVFHFPRGKSRELTTAKVEKAIVIATKTPRGPSPARCASSQASGIFQSRSRRD
jgi:hypothetical protein